MLPASHRLRNSADFTAVFRARPAQRIGSRCLVVHAARPAHRRGLPARVGFVVSKAVGNAVVRNRVKRRLRAQVRPLILPNHASTDVEEWVDGVDLVIRATPKAAGADSHLLGTELGRAFDTLHRRWAVG